MIIPVGPARNLASQAALSSLVGFPLRSILGKKYKPSPGKKVRSVETIRSSLDNRVKPTPLSSTMWEMPPHTNIVVAPASVPISHLYKNLIGPQSRIKRDSFELSLDCKIVIDRDNHNCERSSRVITNRRKR